jgi:hypothetical protein
LRPSLDIHHHLDSGNIGNHAIHREHCKEFMSHDPHTTRHKLSTRAQPSSRSAAPPEGVVRTSHPHQPSEIDGVTQHGKYPHARPCVHGLTWCSRRGRSEHRCWIQRLASTCNVRRADHPQKQRQIIHWEVPCSGTWHLPLADLPLYYSPNCNRERESSWRNVTPLSKPYQTLCSSQQIQTSAAQ